MRHLKAGNRLGVTTAHRLAMMRNMVTSIIENGQITCTLARAKEVRKPLEKMIGLGKRGTLHSRRQALRFVKSKEAMAQLFGDLAERYKDRNGGYCRIIKLGKNRLGDNSEMAIIQLLGSEGDKLSELKTQKGSKKKQKKKENTVLKEVNEEILQVPETEENAEKELKQENVTQESGTEESAEAENKIESGEEELIQAKGKIASRVVLRSERPMGRLMPLGFNWVYRSEYRKVQEDLDRLGNITSREIRQLLDDYPLSSWTTVGLGPLTGSEVSVS